MSNKIKKDDPRLTAFVLGELSLLEAEQIQNAISNSPELAGAIEEIRMAVQLLGTAYQSESPMVLLDQQKSELVQVVEEESGDLSASVSGEPDGLVDALPDRQDAYLANGRKSRLWLPIILAASLIGLLVGGAFYFDRAEVSSSIASKMEQAKGMSDSELEKIKTKAKENWQVESNDFSLSEVPPDEVGAQLTTERFNAIRKGGEEQREELTGDQFASKNEALSFKTSEPLGERDGLDGPGQVFNESGQGKGVVGLDCLKVLT